MSVFHRLGNLISEDIGAVIPGSNTPLNRETGFRLLLYLALLLFMLTLLLPDIFAPRYGGIRERGTAPPESQPPGRLAPDRAQPEPELEERSDVRESEQI